MEVQSSSQKIVQKYGSQKKKKKIVNSFLNFRRVTHFRLCMLETQVRGHCPAAIRSLCVPCTALQPDHILASWTGIGGREGITWDLEIDGGSIVQSRRTYNLCSIPSDSVGLALWSLWGCSDPQGRVWREGKSWFKQESLRMKEEYNK